MPGLLLPRPRAPKKDYLPLALFATAGKDEKAVPSLRLTKRRLHAGDNKFELTTARELAKAVLDPATSSSTACRRTTARK